jgi:heme/copper-type cytochrome/quinol oxidase subunit 2
MIATLRTHRPLKSTVLKWTVLLLALAVVLLAANAALACPTCSEAANANDPEHQGMVKGYFYSILFMMGMPYTVFTCFGLYMYREVRKARAARDAAKLTDGKLPNDKPPGNQLPR